MKNSIGHAVILGLALALLLAGCGSASGPPVKTRPGPTGDSSSATPPSPMNTPGPPPADLPVYPGAQLLVSQYIATGTLYFYRAPDSLQQVSSFYQNQMPEYGWQEETAEQNGSQGMYLVYTKDTRSVMMNVVPDTTTATDTDISIILSNS